MRIDHVPTQSLLLPHTPRHTAHHHTTPAAAASDLPLVPAEHAIASKDNSYHILQTVIEDSSIANHDMCPMRIGSKGDGFERKGQAWFVATELQSDLVVEVGDMSFHLHKFPLLSRSGKLNHLVFDSRDAENSHIQLEEMPGGPETFELAAKFCYGVAVELTAANVAALRCAAEYLEMTEDLDEGNLISKTESFLSFVVLASWKDSVAVLHSCEKLLPWAEDLQIVRRCCESIAWKACTDPRGIRWSFTERMEAKKTNHSSPIWNGPKSHASSISDQVPSDWWFEDICIVCVAFFTKIIQAIKVKGMRHDLIGSAVVHYAIRWLPGLTRDAVVGGKEVVVSGGRKELPLHHHQHQHPAEARGDNHARTTDVAIVQDRNLELVDALCGVLPSQKDSVPCTFLLRLLRLAKMVGVSPMVLSDLEKRAGLQLDQGTLSDLLIPSFDHTCETLFDVDLVQRMLDYFLLQEFVSTPGTTSPVDSEKEKSLLNPAVDKTQGAPHSTYAAKMRVAKLIDNYLAEVGRDQNLTLLKFLALAEALPEHTRVTDDGLYKAIDTYLKAHPGLSEHERKKLCRTLDCQRLSLDACMHAAQNERLPLRVVVQVLLGEQIKLRNAVTGTSGGGSTEHSGPYPGEDDQMSMSRSSHDSIIHDHEQHGDRGEEQDESEEIKVLRSDVERMKGKFMALQHDYSSIQHQLEKLTKHPKQHAGWKKLLPHPHFHVPHFLSHPMDLFHHKDHHHRGKDHNDKDHHHHGKDHHDKDHHHHGKDQHESHSHHNGKDHHESHGHHNGKDHHESHSHHNAKDHHESHSHHNAKDHHESHGHHNGKDHLDNHSHHHGKDHHGNHHHGKDHHDSHHHHGKDHHDSHHHQGKDHHDSHHHHGKDHHDSHHHHGKDHHDSNHHHGKDHHDSHHHHGKEHHGTHHHGKDHHDARRRHSKEHESTHRHSKEHDSAHLALLDQDHNHHHRHSGKSQHGHGSKDHDSSSPSLHHHHDHHSKDRRPSHGKDYEYYVDDHFYHIKGVDALQGRTSFGKDNEDHHRHLPPRDPSHVSSHSKHSDNHHSKDHSSHHSKELLHSNSGHAHHVDHSHSRTVKHTDSPRSSSHPESGEESATHVEGPSTPTHPGEHQKKHARPFANAIRKWRNSIS